MNTVGSLGLTVGVGEFEILTSLMKLSCRIADAGMGLFETKETACGMDLMNLADQLSEHVGTLATLRGFTISEVTTPLWRRTGPEGATGRVNHGEG